MILAMKARAAAILRVGVLASVVSMAGGWPASGASEPSFFPFCIDWHDAKKRSFDEQATMLKELGYEGVGHIWLDKVSERLSSLDRAGLRLFQITMTVDLSGAKPAYDARFKEVLGLVKGRRVQFDLLVNGRPVSDPQYDELAVGILREMSAQAAGTDAQLLLYPHQGSWIERLEDSMRVADKVDRPKRRCDVQSMPLAARGQQSGGASIDQAGDA
jgi:sugar phosphate isomerase/epimerase